MEYDRGDAIEGYLIPDGFADEPSVVITRSDGKRLLIPCDQPRPAVVQSGRHATGLVGFRVDRSRVPDLVDQKNLSIHDEKTGLLVYRRSLESRLRALKVLRLEMAMIPALKFDQYCGRFFQYAISSVERFGHETTLQVFHLNAVPSIFLSGRLYLRNYEEFLDKGFHVIADLPDPYYEMASRLVVLKRLANSPITFISDRDRIFLAPAAAHFAQVDFDDDRAIKRSLKKATDNVRNVIVSPATRQLVCSHAEQKATRRDVAPAIDALSRFKVLGNGDPDGHFHNAIGELLEVTSLDMPIVPRHSVLIELAERLRQLPIAELMLEEDLILDHYVQQAVQQSCRLSGLQ